MIALGLEECKKLGITRVLMTCKKENTGSAKSIMNNGGILENEIEKEDGTVMPVSYTHLTLPTIRLV